MGECSMCCKALLVVGRLKKHYINASPSPTMVEQDKKDTYTDIQRSAKLLRVSIMLLGVSNNVMLQDDCISRGRELLCKTCFGGRKPSCVL